MLAPLTAVDGPDSRRWLIKMATEYAGRVKTEHACGAAKYLWGAVQHGDENDKKSARQLMRSFPDLVLRSPATKS
jgi:hypothetical protein